MIHTQPGYIRLVPSLEGSDRDGMVGRDRNLPPAGLLSDDSNSHGWARPKPGPTRMAAAFPGCWLDAGSEGEEPRLSCLLVLQTVAQCTVPGLIHEVIFHLFDWQLYSCWNVLFTFLPCLLCQKRSVFALLCPFCGLRRALQCPWNWRFLSFWPFDICGKNWGRYSVTEAALGSGP